MKLSVLILLLFICSLVVAKRSSRRHRIVDKYSSRHHKVDSDRKCGYEGCPPLKPGMINVHIVPHSHDDVGWLKTVEQYYYGSRNDIQKAGVQYILDSVVQELLFDPERKFIYVESAFFFHWWNEQTDARKEQVKQLVNEGRLEFIGGAWSMNDEANVNYQSVIDQFTWGLRHLNETFGECGRPRVIWQIDPFGHSRETASSLAMMGYDGLFIGRLDIVDKINRLTYRNAEMVWEGSPNLGEKADLFTGVLFNDYAPPPGFCFDITCNDEPIIDDERSPNNNVQRRVDAFIEYINNMTVSYATDNLILTMGEDFHYQAAGMWYTNLDKLILYVNERQTTNNSNIHLFYSTPSCYLKALHESTNVTSWPTKSDDFFPYASDPFAYWTGYFTSRPTSKRYERIGNNFLQICKQLSALAPIRKDEFEPNLSLLREAMGIMQHHDAITGTEKQHVADDYHRLLHLAIESCAENTDDVLRQITTAGILEDFPFQFTTCSEHNISSCAITEQSDRVILTVYNPTPHDINQYIRLPVEDGSYSVRDGLGIEHQVQLVPISDSVANIHYRNSTATHEIIFLATMLPPLGYQSYFVTKNSGNRSPTASTIVEKRADDDFTIGSAFFTLSFNASGKLTSVTANGETSRLEQIFFYYRGVVGDNREYRNRSSGAYVFRPMLDEPIQILSENLTYTILRGLHVDEVHQVFNSWLSQVIRVYKDENYAEFDWIVGEIPIDDGFSKEIVSRFITDIETNGVFETDSNGREMIRRVRNHRDTWQLYLEEPIPGNYYPVTGRIAIQDNNQRLAVMNDRAQGGSSLVDGTLELMIHRRLLHDDAFGVGEALNETAFGHGLIVRGTHWLTFGSVQHSIPTIKAQERFIQLRKLLQCWTFVSDALQLDYQFWQSSLNHTFHGLANWLPINIHVLTLEPWTNNNTLLIRFEHIMERNEDPIYSAPVTFNLTEVASNLNYVAVRETTLAANQWLDEQVPRFKFPKRDDKKSHVLLSENDKAVVDEDRDTCPADSYKGSSTKNIELITLEPMQIRTFVLFL